jgi:hypothetical protein
MEPERTTKVLTEREDPTPPRLNVAAFLRNRERLSRLLLCLALGTTAVSLLALGILAASAGRPVEIVVLDPNGNIIVAPGVRFEEATELHLQQALLVTSTLLTRHPKDFDQPEILKTLCTREALAQASELKATESKEFLDREIEQKPHVTRVDAISKRKGEVQVQVVGELVRFGVVQHAPYRETIPFTLRLDLKHNTDLLRNRRQPTLLKSFAISYEAQRRE